MILTKCDYLLWMCNDHKDQLLELLLTRTSHLLIRNECQRINLMFAEAETPIGNMHVFFLLFYSIDYIVI